MKSSIKRRNLKRRKGKWNTILKFINIQPYEKLTFQNLLKVFENRNKVFHFSLLNENETNLWLRNDLDQNQSTIKLVNSTWRLICQHMQMILLSSDSNKIKIRDQLGKSWMRIQKLVLEKGSSSEKLYQRQT